MSKKVFLFEKLTPDSQTLFEFVKEKLFFDKKIRFTDQVFTSYITRGFVKVDDRIEKNPKKLIKKKQFVSIVVLIKDIKKFQRPPKPELHLSKEHILFEDEYIIVLNKPAGIPTHATLDPDRDHLVASLTRYLKKRDGKIPYIGLHHRLDKDTSGVVLFTKQQGVNKAMSELFEKRKIKKTYIAAVFSENLKKDEWTVENYLKRKPSAQIMQSVPKNTEDADHAITEFEVYKKGKKFSLIHVHPLTGRTHQIRVHLHEDGLSILGDVLYNRNGSEKFDRFFLHAYKLRFKHPHSNFMIELEAEIPQEFLKVLDKN